MLRTASERSERQQTLRERNQEVWDAEFLTLEDCALAMKISRSSARRLFRFEPGVEVWHTPGSRRPIIRVPRSVYDRVMRRSANPVAFGRRG
jgi:hypothetical protein